MSSLDQRQQKQQFLRAHIINPGYCTEAFSTFLHSKRDDGCNIDTWTIAQLETIINEFKSMNKPEDALSADAENTNSNPSPPKVPVQTVPKVKYSIPDSL